MQYLMLVCTDSTAEPYRKELDTIEQWVDTTEWLRPGQESVVITVRGDRDFLRFAGLRLFFPF